MKRLRYTDFVNLIDLDAVYDEIGWSPERSTEEEDFGYCLDPHGRHKHGDTTGKLAINRNKMVYNCWVCGGGTILSWVMENEELSIHDATEWLYRHTKSRTLTPDEFYAEIESILDDGKPEDKPMPFFNTKVLDRFAALSPELAAWREDRHISIEVCAHFNLRSEAQHVRYGEVENYIGPAIIIPHFFKEKLVGWQERWLLDDRPKWVPKYTNTSEFPREDTLWGYDFCRKSNQQPFLVESVPSALFLIREGYPAMATFGSNITEQQIKLLRQFTQGVILAPDNDGAGKGWLNGERALVRKLERYVPVLVAPYVEVSGGDLGDLTPEELAIHLRGVGYHY